MKKSSLFIIIVFGCVFGTALSLLTVDSSSYKKISVSLNTNDNTNVVQWATFTAANDFTLQYPQAWSVNPDLNGLPRQENEWQFVLVGDEHPNGVIDTYPFIITRLENPDTLDCQDWLQKDMEKQIKAMVDRGGTSKTDAENFFHLFYQPTTIEFFPNYKACRLPDGRGENILTTYFVTRANSVYEITFPRPGLPADHALNSTGNAVIAGQIMDSLVFRKD